MEPGSGISTLTRLRRMARIAPQAVGVTPGLAAGTIAAVVVEYWWGLLVCCLLWVPSIYVLREVWRRAATEGG